MYASVINRSLTAIYIWRVGYLCVGIICSINLRPSVLLSTLSGVISLVGNLRDVPYFTCAAVYFLKISANVYNAFKYSIPGDGKGDAGNGFLRELVILMADFVSRDFDDKDGNCHCCGKNYTLSLTQSTAVFVTYIVQQTCSSPRCPVRSHSLVCSENSLLIVGIGPILNKELELIFRSVRSDRTCVYS